MCLSAVLCPAPPLWKWFDIISTKRQWLLAPKSHAVIPRLIAIWPYTASTLRPQSSVRWCCTEAITLNHQTRSFPYPPLGGKGRSRKHNSCTDDHHLRSVAISQHLTLRWSTGHKIQILIDNWHGLDECKRPWRKAYWGILSGCCVTHFASLSFCQLFCMAFSTAKTTRHVAMHFAEHLTPPRPTGILPLYRLTRHSVRFTLLNTPSAARTSN